MFKVKTERFPDILVLSKQKAVYDLSKVIGTYKKCYYLSSDYLTLIEIRRKFGYEFSILSMGAKFHDVIEGIEKAFLYFSHKINLKNQSEVFWGNALASRNSSSIPLLEYLTYFNCAKELIAHSDSRIVLVCESPALMKVIKEEAEDQGFSCHIEWFPLDVLSWLKVYLKIFLRGIYFLISGVMRWLYARLLKNERIDDEPHSEKYILRSWVTAGNLDGEGRYKDRNFGVLPEHLSEQGKDVWILPMFFNLDKNIFAQLKLMSRSRQKFIFSEQYLSILDLLRTLRDGIEAMFLDLHGCEFEERDFSPVVREIHLKRVLSPNLMSLNSCKYLMKNLAKTGIKIDRVVYPIENNAPEKPFILSIRRYYPEVKIIGFQHTVWFKEQLGMYLHSEEVRYHPLPDEIVCSGPRYLDILQKAGFPSKSLKLGPNLRYTMVNRGFKWDYENELHDERTMLIVLNFDFNHAMEVLEKIGMALSQIEVSKIYIKAHPDSPVNQLERFLRYIAFPPYEWATGTVQEWVVRVNVVVMTGGSVSNLETMATGVPLLRISLGNNFDLDPLWDEYPFCGFVDSPSEIAKYLDAAFHMNSSERDRLAEFGREVVKGYFEPITPDNLRAFL